MAAASISAAVGLSSIAPSAQQKLTNSSQGSVSSTRHLVACPSKSQFFGCARSSGFSGTRSLKVPVKSGQNAIVSASFFEKLGKLFSGAAEEPVEQVMGVFEFNEGDRNSPFVCKNNRDHPTLAVGDFIPYTNKVYDCTSKRYLGISSGLCVVVEHHKPTGGARYETTMSHYMGEYGHISCQGPYLTYADSEMVVTGGTGIFKGATGIVKCHNIKGPLMLLYTYYLKGIPTLPSDLTKPPVQLDEEIRAANKAATAKVNA